MLKFTIGTPYAIASACVKKHTLGGGLDLVLARHRAASFAGNNGHKNLNLYLYIIIIIIINLSVRLVSCPASWHFCFWQCCITAFWVGDSELETSADQRHLRTIVESVLLLRRGCVCLDIR